MKKLKVLALSDLHLGEKEGLLFNEPPDVTDILVEKICEFSKGDGDFADGIEELILIGDIADLSEALLEEAYANTRFLLGKLLEKVDIDRVIYVPGNHDHNLWVEMVKTHYGKKDYGECAPRTNLVIKNPKPLIDSCFPADYKGEVEARYPYYMVETDNASFLFDHGHLFSSLLIKLAGSANSLEEMEDKTWEFMETIWFKGKSRLRIIWNNFREKIYDLLRRFKLKARYPNRRTTFDEDSRPVFDDDLRGRIVDYLEKMVGPGAAGQKDFHLVFGHTHHGGRVSREDRKIRVNGRFINIWNTGGWLVPSDVFSPDAYVFYVEQTSSGLRPRAYKLVAKEGDEEGDYDRKVLIKRAGGIG